VNDLFAKGEQIATHDIVCYINSDIVLMSDFIRAVQGVAGLKHRFLMVGQRCNIDVTQPLDFDSGWEERFRNRLTQEGRLGDLTAIDYFVFPRGLWGEIPPFALGRTMWDDWLLSRALARDAILIDATPVIVAAHQNHDYSTKPGGWKWIWEGPEAQRNCELAGWRGQTSSLRNATHFLTPHGLEFAYERLHLSSFLNALRIVHPSLRLPVNLALKAIAAARPLSAWKRRMFPTGLPLFRIRER
jgi:hypothetical protein